MEDRRAVHRKVEIDQRTSLEAEVLGGLESGDEAIVYPGENVADGVLVAARRW